MDLEKQWAKTEQRFAVAEQGTIDIAMRVPEGPEILDMLMDVKALKEDAKKAWQGDSPDAYYAAKSRLIEKIEELVKFGNEAIRRYNDNAKRT